MGFDTAEYLKLRKKRLEEEEKKNKKTTKTTSESTSRTSSSSKNFDMGEYLKLREQRIANGETMSFEDIAPIGTTISTPQEEKRTWFKSGALEDGYDFGDVSLSIGQTTADVGMGVLQGLGNMAEGVTDLLLYGVSGVSDLVGADSFADDVKDLAKNQSVNDAFDFIREETGIKENSFLGDKSYGVTQGLGQLAGIALTGGAGTAAGLSSAGISALTTGTLFSSSMGSGMSEAYQEGASDGDALKYGIMTGTAEALSEMIFGGMGKSIKALGYSKGLTQADDILAKAISSKIKSRVLKTAVQAGVKASAEGLEEVVAGYGSALAKKLSYKSEEEWKQLVEDENLMEQFVTGALVSGIAQGGGALRSIKHDTDFVSGMHTNEEKVINKVHEDLISEQEEKEGKKLTKKEKDELYDVATKMMEKGYIDTDTIESVLGGKEYADYKSSLDQRDSLQKEYDKYNEKSEAQREKRTNEIFNALKNKAPGKHTIRGYQIDVQGKHLTLKTPNGEKITTTLNDSGFISNEDMWREVADIITDYEGYSDYAPSLLTETQTKLDEAVGKSYELRKKLNTKMQSLVKDTKLTESYMESTRRKQSFTADLDSYDNEYAKQTVKNFMEHTKSHNGNATHDYVDFLTNISKARNHTFDFMSTKQLEESIKNGNPYGIDYGDPSKIEAFVSKDKKTIVINMDANKSFNSLVGHETVHTLERLKAYDKLQKAVFKYAKTKGEYNDRLESVKRRYKNLDADGQNKELTSDLLGDYIFSDPDFVRSLSTEQPNVFRFVWDEIKYLYKMATAGSREARELERVKHLFEKIWRETESTKKTTKENSDAGAKLSVSQVDGIDYVNAEKNIFTKEDGTLASEREVFNSLVGKKIALSDGEIEIVKRLPQKNMYDELFGRYPAYRKNVEDIKQLNSDVNYNMEELLSNSNAISTDEPDVNDRHAEQGITSFDTRKVKFYDGDKAYNIELSIAKLQDGRKIAYAKKFFGYDADLTKKIQTAEGRRLTNTPFNQQSAFDTIIPQNSEKSIGKAQLSIAEDDNAYLDAVKRGDTETAQRMVDEAAKRAGYTIKAYHGTNADFTVFDKNRIGKGIDQYGAGFYFASNPDVTEGYGKNRYGTYLNIKKPINLISKPGGNGKTLFDIHITQTQAYQILKRHPMMYDAENSPLGDFYDEYWDVGAKEWMVRDLAKKYNSIGLLDSDIILFRDYPNELHEAIRDILGYDGVRVYFETNAMVDDRNDYFYVAWFDNQMKSSDPITYDNDGNVIPLSERFNSKNNDIRYSIATEYESLPKTTNTMTPTAANLRKNTASVRDVRNETMLKNNYTESEVKQVNDFMDNMASFMEKASVTYKYIGLDDVNNAKLKVVYDKNGNPKRITMSAMVQNGDYPVNFDFTSICKKRQSMSMVIKELATRKDANGKRVLDTVNLDANALWKINEELRKAGLETACLGCFVESKRYNVQNFADKAVNMWNSIVDEVRAEQGKTTPVEYFNFAEGIDLDSVNYDEIDRIFNAYNQVGGRTSPEARMRALIQSGGDMYQKHLQPSDIMTPEGIEGLKSLSTKKNNFYGIIQGVYGQAAPKEIMGFSPYNSEVALLPDKKDGKKLAEYIASIGGVRMQSFSDFVVSNVYDYMQMVADLSARHLPAHAYTKEIAFAKIFGLTGIKINMSVMFDIDPNLPDEYAGLQFVPDPNGDEEYNGVKGRFEYLVGDKKRSDSVYEATGNRPYVQSIGFDEAVELQNTEGYSKNVGIIGVGFSDKHIIKMLGDNNIRYVIPYHSSSLPSVIKGVTNIKKAKDYTDFQNTIRKSDGKKLAGRGEFDIYKDVEKTQNPKETADNYLWYCADKGYTPVFEQFAWHENYYKLLFDFDPYDTLTGEYSPQTEVSNVYKGYNATEGNFSTAEVEQIIDDEMRTQNEANKQRNEKLPDVVDNVLEQLGVESDRVGFSIAYDEEYTPKEYGHFNTYAKDLALQEDIAPTQEAPQEDIAPTPKVKTTVGDEEKGKPKQFATRKELHENIINDMKSSFSVLGYDLDKVLKDAKNLSTFATVDNIPQRVMEKALGYKQGQILADLTVNQVAQNETEGTRWLNSFLDRKNGLLAKISKQYHIKPGSKESAAAQMYAEGFYVDENNDIIKYGDEELAKDFPDLRTQLNIKGLATDERIRQVYDDTLARINASRTRNAYPEIPRLDNYFLHFRAMEDTFSRLGLPFNPNDIRAKDLPTDLNGVTADLKPGQPYFASANHRTGKRTSFDLLGGLERYLTSAKNQIYHIDDIQKLRALRNYIADNYGQANGLEGIDTLSEEEAQDRIEKVYGSHLSTFAKFLNEEANILAGKTALIDRGLEGIIGRRGITLLDTLNKQVGSNMVGFNLSSSLTNFLPVAQTFAKTNKLDFVKAFAQTASNKIGSMFGKEGDGFVDQSPVMIRRKGADRFYRTWWQKRADEGYIFMSAVDDISTELIARTKYNELTRKGMDSQKAHYETDKWVSRLMGDRSLGQMPQLYNSKMLGLFTKFQLEVRNQLDSQFYDTIQEAKVSNEDIQNGLARNAKTAAKVGATFLELAVVQHLFGKAFESVAGYNPAFDIISVLMTALGFDDEEESEDTALDNVEQAFLDLSEDLPYTSVLTGGRIPISSALPVGQLFSGKDDYGNEKSRWETFKEAVPYYLLPTGYGQLKKTAQGLSMFDDDLPIAGSYTDSGNLRFPVEDTLGNRIQAGIFGQWANQNARDYFDNDYAPLKEKQIEELIETDLPYKDYQEYRKAISGAKTLNAKGDYIANMDIPIDTKNILINNVADRGTPIDMTGYENYLDFEEFDFATRYPEKYKVLQEAGISVHDYKDNIEETAFIHTDDYSWAASNSEKYTLSKAITDDVTQYRDITAELNNIKGDKDANGKTISGSAKEKKAEYINNLDLDYGQKIILYRSYFDSKEDKKAYNADILEYLNSRDDLTYEEKASILIQLDFKVRSDGRVEW